MKTGFVFMITVAFARVIILTVVAAKIFPQNPKIPRIMRAVWHCFGITNILV